MAQVLVGQRLPPLSLRATRGADVDLSNLKGLSIIYAYPRISPPDGTAIAGWSNIPGAKGCTPQSCGFRDHFAELTDAGVAQVFGLSTQSTSDQCEAVDRLHLPFVLLSDDTLQLQKALDLPVFKVEGMTLLHRLTMIVRDGQIEHVFDNISDPAGNAAAVLEFIATR